MKIESLGNKKVKEWAKLKLKKYRDQEGLFLIEGDHLLKEALEKECVKEILASDSQFKVEGILFYEVSEAILKKISSQESGTTVLAVCFQLKSRAILGNVCLLDCIQDPGNLGTILRSCVAFGIDTLISSVDTVDFYNEKVLRASEGSLFHLNLMKKDLKAVIQDLKEKGYTLYATNVHKGRTIKEMTLKHKYAIIMGNEGQGVNEALQDLADYLLYIPMSEGVESLNVGVATSIVLYEFFMSGGNG